MDLDFTHDYPNSSIVFHKNCNGVDTKTIVLKDEV